MSEPKHRTVGDLYDAMAAAKTVADMRVVYWAEVEFQKTGTDPDPEEVARHNMAYVAGYGSSETRQRIMRLLKQARV
jgi:hypothetical protein